MTMIDATDLVLKILVFGWFGYARCHFASAGKEPFGMTAIKIAFVTGLGMNLWLIFLLNKRGDVYSVLGLFTTALSAIVFYCAVRASRASNLHVAFSETTGAFLVSSGIYRLVRDPFYLS
jgi:protein-S-isoprenylcysteine O-methyltransferase Ste14